MSYFSNVWLISLLVATGSCVIGPTWAYEDNSWPGHYAPGTKFKLRAAEFSPDVFEITNANGWKPPRKVDSRLIDQIRQMRLALPNWQGVHYLKPGANGS